MKPAVPRGRTAVGLTSSVVALVLSGVLVNAYLVLVARHVPAHEYVAFSAYWSMALILGLGVFLPIEQELARALGSRSGDITLARRMALSALLLVMAEVVALLAALPLVLRVLGGNRWMLPAVAGLCLVSAGQFLCRGVLIGTNQLGWYAVAIIVDSVLRVGLAVLVAVLGATTAPAYAWVLVASIGLAHLPLLVMALRRLSRAASGTGSTARGLGGGVVVLLLGSLGAQALLNAPPLLVSAVSSATTAERAASFQAAFQLARIPLFLAVPLQATLVPLMVRWLAQTTSGHQARLLGRFVLGTAVVATVGGIGGALIGPPVLRLLFGPAYNAPAGEIGLLVAGAAVYLGLVVLTQGLVAAGHHVVVAVSWIGGVVLGASVFQVLDDPVAGASWGFAVGNSTALLVGAGVAMFHRRSSAAT